LRGEREQRTPRVHEGAADVAAGGGQDGGGFDRGRRARVGAQPFEVLALPPPCLVPGVEVGDEVGRARRGSVVLRILFVHDATVIGGNGAPIRDLIRIRSRSDPDQIRDCPSG
jgi:hypothetical protein